MPHAGPVHGWQAGAVIRALSVDQVRGISLGTGITLVAIALVVLLVVRWIVAKVVTAVVLLALAGGVFVGRSRISIDRATCSASAFGHRVSVPARDCPPAQP